MAVRDDISFERFNQGHPSNISERITTREELAETQGHPQRDPVLHRLWDAQAVHKFSQFLSLDPASAQINQPLQPEFNPYEGPPPFLSLSRSARSKLNSQIFKKLKQLVITTQEVDPETQGLMQDSFQRVQDLVAFLDHFITMVERVHVQAVAASRG